MRPIWAVIIARGVAVTACIGGAVAILLSRGGEGTGWGWLLLVALLLSPSGVESTSKPCASDPPSS